MFEKEFELVIKCLNNDVFSDILKKVNGDIIVIDKENKLYKLLFDNVIDALVEFIKNDLDKKIYMDDVKLDPARTFIAGSYGLSIFLETITKYCDLPSRLKWKPNDIDIFTYDPNGLKQSKVFPTSMSLIANNRIKNEKIKYFKKWCLNVNLVKTQHMNIKEIFDGFDIPCCQAGFSINNEEFYITKKCLFAIITGINKMDIADFDDMEVELKYDYNPALKIISEKILQFELRKKDNPHNQSINNMQTDVKQKLPNKKNDEDEDEDEDIKNAIKASIDIIKNAQNNHEKTDDEPTEKPTIQNLPITENINNNNKIDDKPNLSIYTYEKSCSYRIFGRNLTTIKKSDGKINEFGFSDFNIFLHTGGKLIISTNDFIVFKFLMNYHPKKSTYNITPDNIDQMHEYIKNQNDYDLIVNQMEFLRGITLIRMRIAKYKMRGFLFDFINQNKYIISTYIKSFTDSMNTKYNNAKFEYEIYKEKFDKLSYMKDIIDGFNTIKIELDEKMKKKELKKILIRKEIEADIRKEIEAQIRSEIIKDDKK